VDTFGIERGDVLLSLQMVLTREEEAARAAGWSVPAAAPTQHRGPIESAPRMRPPLTDVPAPTRPIVMLDPGTGAGTLHALRRDLGLRREDDRAGGGTAVIALDFKALDQIRLVLGDDSAEDVIKGLVEVAPFALGARDAVYRSGRDQLILLLRGANDEAVEAARAALQSALGRFLTDRGFPEVGLGARRVDPATLAG
jgi:GGDEF domain-containing protein